MTAGMLTPMEQRLQDLERAVGERHQVEMQYQQLSGPAAVALRPKLEAAVQRERRLRVTALQSIQSGDVTSLIRADVYKWGMLMAGALVAATPPLVIYAFLMDYYIAGLTAGATKG